jgi:hypothetical protein
MASFPLKENVKVLMAGGAAVLVRRKFAGVATPGTVALTV